jgi:hypothetical protein
VVGEYAVQRMNAASLAGAEWNAGLWFGNTRLTFSFLSRPIGHLEKGRTAASLLTSHLEEKENKEREAKKERQRKEDRVHIKCHFFLIDDTFSLDI